MDAEFKNIVDLFFDQLKNKYCNREYSEEEKKEVMQVITSEVNNLQIGFTLEQEEEYIDDKLSELFEDIIFGSSDTERI